MLFGDLYFFIGVLLKMFVAVPIGAFVGGFTAWVVAKHRHRTPLGPVVTFMNLLCGMVGMFSGFSAAFAGFSLSERWENGELVSLRVTGHPDLAIPLALIGAIGLAIVWQVIYPGLTAYIQGAGREAKSRVSWLSSTGRLLSDSAAKWCVFHVAVRLAVLGSIATIAPEIVRGDQRHWRSLFIHRVEWLSISTPVLVFAVAVALWWSAKAGSFEQKRRTAIDVLFVFGWIVLFIVTLGRMVGIQIGQA